MNARWMKWALKKYAPDILTGMAIGGTFVTGWLGVKAGEKVANEKIKLTFGLNTSDDVTSKKTLSVPTKKQEFEVVWKCYIPPVASAVVTSACMIGAHKVHLHNEAVLAAVAAMYSDKYRQLANSVKDALPQEEYVLVQEAVAKNDATNLPPWLPQPKEGETLYYEPISEQYFCATPQAMLYAQLHINKMLQEYWGVTLNDYLSVLPGCLPITEGYEIGWYQGTDDWQEIWNQLSQDGVFIDIEFVDVPMDDNGAAYVGPGCPKRIWYNVQPAPPDEDWEPFK